MKYSVIIPTYQRPEKLIRAVQSVLSGQHSDFEIICINDSPGFNYMAFDNFWINLDQKYKDKIRYFLNTKNEGVNASRNKALQHVTFDSDYVIFLDDDDWFGKDALREIDTYLSPGEKKQKTPWLMTNRVMNGISLTQNNTGKNKFDYFYNYLLTKKVRGDATHVIRRDVAVNYYFSKKVKNGEEWFYFIQLPSRVQYASFNTTESEGYDAVGLNAGMQSTYKENTRLLWGEVIGIKMFIYMAIRSAYGIIKR